VTEPGRVLGQSPKEVELDRGQLHGLVVHAHLAGTRIKAKMPKRKSARISRGAGLRCSRLRAALMRAVNSRGLNGLVM